MAGTLDPVVARKFAPEHPVHVLDIHGTKDMTVPFDGGDVAAQGGRCISVPAMMGLWARANGCKGEPTSEYLPDKDPADGIRGQREVYEARPKGAEVVLYVGEGLGHVWPGDSPPGRVDRRGQPRNRCHRNHLAVLLGPPEGSHTAPAMSDPQRERYRLLPAAIRSLGATAAGLLGTGFFRGLGRASMPIFR